MLIFISVEYLRESLYLHVGFFHARVVVAVSGEQRSAGHEHLLIERRVEREQVLSAVIIDFVDYERFLFLFFADFFLQRLQVIAAHQ